MLSQGEKEKLAEKMLSQGKSFRQIMKKTHMSPNDISQIKKRLLGLSAESKHTQAYRLYGEGKDILDVALTLGLTEEQALKFRIQFLRMIRHVELENLHNQPEEKIQALLALESGLSALDISVEQYLYFLAIIQDKEKYELERQKMANEIDQMALHQENLQRKVRESEQRCVSNEKAIYQEGIEVQALRQEKKELVYKNARIGKLIEKRLNEADEGP